MINWVTKKIGELMDRLADNRRTSLPVYVNMMKKLPDLYSLSPWRERVRVRGINLHAIRNTQYDILMTDLIDELVFLFLILLDTRYYILS
ncbi:MAG: hypothetical protein U9N03_00730 [Candidatus Caldatribacteriota bacterium]|nr:hypothetical protein [Candidatus Caldatribacteriota bacterium]